MVEFPTAPCRASKPQKAVFQAFVHTTGRQESRHWLKSFSLYLDARLYSSTECQAVATGRLAGKDEGLVCALSQREAGRRVQQVVRILGCLRSQTFYKGCVWPPRVSPGAAAAGWLPLTCSVDVNLCFRHSRRVGGPSPCTSAA